MPFVMCQSRTVSSDEPLATRFPEIATEHTGPEWPVETDKSEPSFVQVFTVLSAEHEARIEPSADHATPKTVPE